MLYEIEFAILDAIQCLRSEPLDAVMKVITAFGNGGIFWILLAAVLCFIPRYRKWGITMGLALFLGLVLGNGLLKNLIARARPFQIREGISLLISAPSEYSFPSGHTLCAVEGATVLWLKNKRIGLLAAVLAAAIAFSRLYLYVHFPTDILGGALLGLVNALLATRLVNRLDKRTP